MFSKESTIIKKSISDYVEKMKSIFKNKYSADDLESDFFTYSITEENDTNINFNIKITELFKLMCIVDKKSTQLKGHYSVAFIVYSTMSYESFKSNIALDKIAIADVVNELNIATCGIKVNITDYDKLLFSFTSDFFINYGVLNDPKIYKRLFIYNFNNALKEVTLIADELAKRMGISE